MADSVYVDLSPVIRAVNQLSGEMGSIAARVEDSNNKIEKIDKEVVDIRSTVNSLTDRFREMMNQQQKSFAATEIVRVRQELQSKFGHYEKIRKNTIGILQANDLALVKEETISSSTEELMLSAPGYWLAPALVALAAWISDDPALANRAIAEAIKRDEEKTYLMFALICRRAGRLNASSQWLGRYFELQDPHNMNDTVINMIDAYSNNLFGQSRDAVCEDSIENWMREIKQMPGFMKEQIDQWTAIFDAHLIPIIDDEYRELSKILQEKEALFNVTARVRNMYSILDMFVSIMNATEDSGSLSEMIDECLYNLVKNYDKEEAPLKKEEQYYSAVIKCGGDTYRAQRMMDAVALPADHKVNFAEQLSKAAMATGELGASSSFRKTSLRLLEKEAVISSSFKKYAQDTVLATPAEATFQISDWKMKIKQAGSDIVKRVEETEKSFVEHVNKAVETATNKIKPVSVEGILAAIAALIIFILGAVFVGNNVTLGVILIIAGIAIMIIGAVRIVKKYTNAKKQKNNIQNAGEEQKKQGSELIRAAYQQYLQIIAFINADSGSFCSDTYQIESLK